MSPKKGRQAAPEPASSTTAPAVPDALLKDVDQVAAPQAGPKKIKVKKAKAAARVAVQASTATQTLPAEKSTNLDDQDTDRAVQEIAVDEADTILALQDVANDTEEEDRLKRRKTRIDLAVFLVLLLIFAAVVLSRDQLTNYYQSLQAWLSQTF